MSRLIQKPTNTIQIGTHELKINTSHRDCLAANMALEDSGLTLDEKLETLLYNIYKVNFPDIRDTVIPNDNESLCMAIILVNNALYDMFGDKDISQIALAALGHLRCGMEHDENKPIDNIFSFTQDGELLYDAFLLKGINLDEVDLTWREFIGHFRELPKDCLLCRVMYLRSQLKKDKATKEEKEECARIGWSVINLKDPEQEQAIDNMENWLNGGV